VRARLKRWAILFRVVSAVFFAKVELIWGHSSLIGRSGGEPLSQQVSGGRFLIGAWGPFLEENAEYEMADDLTEPEAVSCFTVPAAGISVVYASQHSKQLRRCIFKKHPPGNSGDRFAGDLVIGENCEPADGIGVRFRQCIFTDFYLFCAKLISFLIFPGCTITRGIILILTAGDSP
jgi:hypothetical protein